MHGRKGQQLSDAALPPAVVGQAFSWAGEAGISCVAFLGDECATLKLTSELRELHTRCGGHAARCRQQGSCYGSLRVQRVVQAAAQSMCLLRGAAEGCCCC